MVVVRWDGSPELLLGPTPVRVEPSTLSTILVTTSEGEVAHFALDRRRRPVGEDDASGLYAQSGGPGSRKVVSERRTRRPTRATGTAHVTVYRKEKSRYSQKKDKKRSLNLQVDRVTVIPTETIEYSSESAYDVGRGRALSSGVKTYTHTHGTGAGGRAWELPRVGDETGKRVCKRSRARPDWDTPQSKISHIWGS